MRTNIDIDDALMKKALKVSGLSTKREVVEAGLRSLVRLAAQADVKKLFGKFPLDDDLEQSRLDRRL